MIFPARQHQEQVDAAIHVTSWFSIPGAMYSGSKVGQVCPEALRRGLLMNSALFERLRRHYPKQVDINTHPELGFAGVYRGVLIYLIPPLLPPEPVRREPFLVIW